MDFLEKTSKMSYLSISGCKKFSNESNRFVSLNLVSVSGFRFPVANTGFGFRFPVSVAKIFFLESVFGFRFSVSVFGFRFRLQNFPPLNRFRVSVVKFFLES